jgi:hypothetical protein
MTRWYDVHALLHDIIQFYLEQTKRYLHLPE